MSGEFPVGDPSPEVYQFRGDWVESSVTEIDRAPAATTVATASRLQITRSAPATYDVVTDGELTKDDFFISFGLYNSLIPTQIDDKVSISGDTYFWLKVTVSAVNPAYATACVLESGAAVQTNNPPAVGEWPEFAYVNLGRVYAVDGAWVIQNYGNGSVGGGVYLSTLNAGAGGVLDVNYGFSFSRFL